MIIPKNDIQNVLENTNIVDLVSRYITLKKQGNNYVGLCPFHNEKSGSFSVNEERGTYHCFGCGANGDAIAFVREYEKLEFSEAVEKLASEAGVTISKKKTTDKENKDFEEKQRVREANKAAMMFFFNALFEEKVNKDAVKYVMDRISEDIAKAHNIGFAKGGLREHLNKLGYDNEFLVKAGLLKENDNKTYRDYFYNRLIFPYRDSIGNIVGFTGRLIKDDKTKPKYQNTPETIVFDKSKLLYNFYFAKKSAKIKGYIYDVEGNIDALTLQKIGVENVFASSGTGLSEYQINMLRKVCNEIRIIADTDEAGLESMNRQAKMFIEKGFGVKVIKLPIEKTDTPILDNEQKQKLNEKGEPIFKNKKYDADSFFFNYSLQQFNEYVEENSEEYISYYAKEILDTASSLSKVQQTQKHKEIIALVASYPEETANLYLNDLKKINSTIDWSKIITTFRKSKEYKEQLKKQKEAYEHELEEKKPKVYIDDPMEQRNILKNVLPEGVDVDFYLKWGFYSFGKKYYLYFPKNRVDKFYQISNFIIKPIALIKGQDQARRVFEITNEHGDITVVDIKQEQMASVNSFKVAVESCGNYIFEGDQKALDKLKYFMYFENIDAYEVTQFGWQRGKDFWVHANGVSLLNGEFKQTDQYGLIEVNKTNYYIPTFSIINIDKEQLNTDKRKYKYVEREDKITLKDFANDFISFYGDNAKVFLAMLFGIIFKDILMTNAIHFPIMYQYGVKGSGKTTFVKNFMGLFMQNCQEIKIPTTSLPSLADRLSEHSNQPILVDEYRNNIDPAKIEFCKGFFDGVGRVVKNVNDLNKTKTSLAYAAMLMCGQEHINDQALLSRCCILNFFNTKHSHDAVVKNKEFSRYIDEGHLYIVNELLKLRPVFENNFMQAYNNATDKISERIKGKTETRLLSNWSIPLACFDAVKEFVDLPFSYEELLEICYTKLSEQTQINTDSSEINVFWNVTLENIQNGTLRNGYDYLLKLENPEDITLNKKGKCKIEERSLILYINPTKAITNYIIQTKKKSTQTNISFLPESSMRSYLENSEEYIGYKRSVKVVKDVINGKEIDTIKSTMGAFLFDYKLLDIEIFTEEDIALIMNTTKPK